VRSCTTTCPVRASGCPKPAARVHAGVARGARWQPGAERRGRGARATGRRVQAAERRAPDPELTLCDGRAGLRTSERSGGQRARWQRRWVTCRRRCCLEHKPCSQLAHALLCPSGGFLTMLGAAGTQLCSSHAPQLRRRAVRTAQAGNPSTIPSASPTERRAPYPGSPAHPAARPRAPSRRPPPRGPCMQSHAA